MTSINFVACFLTHRNVTTLEVMTVTDYGGRAHRGTLLSVGEINLRAHVPPVLTQISFGHKPGVEPRPTRTC